MSRIPATLDALKAQGRNEEAKSYWRQAINVKPELAKGYFD